MRPLLFLVLAAAVLAGCTKSDPPASQPLTTESSDAAPTPASDPTPDPAPARPPPSPPPAAPTPPAAPPTPPTPPPALPPKPADLWVNKSGWVTPNGQTDPNATIKLPFQVLAGAKRLLANASVNATGPVPAAPAPRHPVSIKITVLDPKGKAIASRQYVASDAQGSVGVLDSASNIALNETDLRVGDYVFVVEIQGGASDGASIGDRYLATVHVAY